MRWVLVILMVLSLWIEGSSLQYSEGVIKQNCCCGQDRPICPPARSCATTTMIPRVVQERTITRTAVAAEFYRIEGKILGSFDRTLERRYCFFASFYSTGQEIASPIVFWHEYFQVWQT